MSTKAKLVLGVTMSLALLLGFLQPLHPDSAVLFKRLHIFLYNLLAGGALIIFFTEKAGIFTRRAQLYFALALIYALSAAVGIYPLTLAVSIPLFLVVESVRIQRFQLFPVDFFRGDVEVCDKFAHAAILCLSMGIGIASLVILNNEYLKLVSFSKLTLDVFFLGYSFPISLVTMSLMFSFMEGSPGALRTVLEEVAFWVVNAGVITFFVFIILEQPAPEMVAASTLFLAVVMIFYLFVKTAPNLQQKWFLVSGMVFLLLTGITGIAYLLRYFFPSLASFREYLLTFHGTISLYGWNLSGLFIVIRMNDFPVRLHSLLLIAFHWLIALVLVPVGKYIPWVSVVALPAYVALLALVFFSRQLDREGAL